MIRDGQVGLAREMLFRASRGWICGTSSACDVSSVCSSRTATNYRDRDENGHVRAITRSVRATHPSPTRVFARAEHRDEIGRRCADTHAD